MAKLILSLDGTIMREVPLDKERLTIGRKPHNDLQIDNLAVSGEHALIVTILNDSFLEDLGSTNGTLVNGVPIKKHILQSNDIVEIGKYKLKYVTEALAAATQSAGPADFEKTMVIRPAVAAAARAAEAATSRGFGSAQAGSAAPAPMASMPPTSTATGAQMHPGSIAAQAAHAAPPASMTQTNVPPATQTNVPPMAPSQPLAAIQILTGPSAGKELELVKNLTTLGKPGVQVAVITRRPQGYFITHVEGANFPIINGKALDSQAHPLRDHDVVELAGVKMEFFLKSA
jgi:pSer/pThr/pTyr-binding forkhead associated (FHA) protein